MPSSKRDQVDYLINLLGRKRNIIEQEVVEEEEASHQLHPTSSTNNNNNNNNDDSNSDFEDIVYTHLTRNEMVEQLQSKTLAGDWVMTVPPIELLYQSSTTEQQDECFNDVLETYLETPELKFYKDAHLNYVMKCLTAKLPSGYKSLDANHPWMMYWLLNSFLVIRANNEEEEEGEEEGEESFLTENIFNLINEKIESCIVDDGRGGIAGGANQMGHLASTYAAVLTLLLTKNTATLLRIKDNLYTWIMSLKKELSNGSSFLMHEFGEYDTRSTYCALVISSLLNVTTPQLIEGVQDWIVSCQTYEGGFAGVPHTEAHGGYTFCAFASLFLLNKEPQAVIEQIKFDKFVRWCLERQTYEGGFSGRTNKLVDACYGFWIGALIPMVDVLRKSHTIDKVALKNYMLRVAQVESGGFRDKPGKLVDFYHTNYALCGLSCCEHKYELHETNKDTCLAFKIVVKSSDNSTFTQAINPVFGVPISFCKTPVE